MSKKLAIILAGVMLCIAAICKAQSKPADTTGIAQEILQYVNAHRDSLGLPKLVMNDTISASAIAHCNYMIGKKELSHDNFEERMKKLFSLLGRANAAAENVADGKLNGKGVVALWLHSPGHRKNIEGSYNTTGIGIVQAQDGKLYFTEIFINRQ